MFLLEQMRIGRFRVAADTIKYHRYLFKKKHSLSLGIYYLPNFNPRLVQPFSANQNDFYVLQDAVRGETPAAEQASSRASATLRRSGKPELIGSAALPKQTDCRVRNKLPAPRSRKK